MHRYRIMNRAGVPDRFETPPGLIPVGKLDRVHVIYVPVGRIAYWGMDPRSRQQQIVTSCETSPCFGPGLQVPKLDTENGRLDRLHAIVVAFEDMVMLCRLSPIS